MGPIVSLILLIIPAQVIAETYWTPEQASSYTIYNGQVKHRSQPSLSSYQAMFPSQSQLAAYNPRHYGNPPTTYQNQPYHVRPYYTTPPPNLNNFPADDNYLGSASTHSQHSVKYGRQNYKSPVFNTRPHSYVQNQYQKSEHPHKYKSVPYQSYNHQTFDSSDEVDTAEKPSYNHSSEDNSGETKEKKEDNPCPKIGSWQWNGDVCIALGPVPTWACKPNDLVMSGRVGVCRNKIFFPSGPRYRPGPVRSHQGRK